MNRVVIRFFLRILAKRPATLLTAMAALAICIGGAESAHATCGDYLIDHDELHGGSAMDSSVHRFLPSDSPLVPVPCHGPSCGEAPDYGVADVIPVESNRRVQTGSAVLQGNCLCRPPVTEHLEIESETATCFVPQTPLRPPEVF